MNAMRDVNKWMRDVKCYIQAIDADLICDQKLIFGIETKIFLTYTEPSRQMAVMVGI